MALSMSDDDRDCDTNWTFSIISGEKKSRLDIFEPFSGHATIVEWSRVRYFFDTWKTCWHNCQTLLPAGARMQSFTLAFSFRIIGFCHFTAIKLLLFTFLTFFCLFSHCHIGFSRNKPQSKHNKVTNRFAVANSSQMHHPRTEYRMRPIMAEKITIMSRHLASRMMKR